MRTIFWTIAILFSLTSVSRGQSRRPDKYFITQNYVGWILIQYEVKGAPRTPIKDGFNVYTLPRTGCVKTSSPRPQSGWAKDEYYYVSKTGAIKPLKRTGWGKGGTVWGGSISDGTVTFDRNGKVIKKSPPTRTVFIGTEQQFKKAGSRPHPK